MIFGTELSAGHHNEKFDFDERDGGSGRNRRASRLTFRQRGVMEAIFSLWTRWLRHNATLTAPSPTTSGTTRRPALRSSGQPNGWPTPEAEGFQLTRDAGGIPNAFIASVGEGQPVMPCSAT